jgi:tetratricopeptide (TPR) repeat protein
VGRLIAFLNTTGQYGNTIIVLTADHGESLGEHRELRHGYFIYDATLRVPLIIKPAAGSIKPRVVTQAMRSIDIAPTILKLVGLPPGKDNQGAEVVGLMSGKQPEATPDIYSESFYPAQFGWSTLRSLHVGNLKYIDAPRAELYDLDQDPRELNNRALDRQAVVAELKARLVALEAAASAPDSAKKAAYVPSAEQLEKLASLGYLGNAHAAAPAGPDGKPKPDPKDMIDVFYEMNRAGVEAGANHCDQAIPDLAEVIHQSPNIEAAYLMLGRCYFIEENFGESMKTFHQLQSLDPDNQDAVFYIAASEFGLGDLAAAESGLKQALAANPKRTYAHKYLGFTYQAENKPDLAIAEFEKVLETSPNDLEAHGKLGFLLASGGRYQDALAHFQKVVALTPSDPLAHYNLGLAYEKLGDKQKTADELAVACRLNRELCGK